MRIRPFPISLFILSWTVLVFHAHFSSVQTSPEFLISTFEEEAFALPGVSCPRCPGDAEKVMVRKIPALSRDLTKLDRKMGLLLSGLSPVEAMKKWHRRNSFAIELRLQEYKIRLRQTRQLQTRPAQKILDAPGSTQKSYMDSLRREANFWQHLIQEAKKELAALDRIFEETISKVNDQMHKRVETFRDHLQLVEKIRKAGRQSVFRLLLKKLADKAHRPLKVYSKENDPSANESALF